MDSKKSIENLFNAMTIVRSNQKAQVTKILELEAKINSINDLETRLDKLEKALDKERYENDRRFDSVSDRFDDIGSILDAHIDSISDLEEHKNEIANKLEVIDDTIKKIDDEIQKIERDKIKIPSETEHNLKLCSFNNFGYCKVGKNNCNFYHSEETCDIYAKNAICYRMLCKKRHPRPCRYQSEGKCYRGIECKFLHTNVSNIDKNTSSDDELAKTCKITLPNDIKESNLQKCSGCKNEKTVFKCEECGKRFGRSCLLERHVIINMYNKNNVHYRCDMVHKNPCI